jgi:hypothetical protein
MKWEVNGLDLRVLGSVEPHNGHRLAVGGPNQRRILAALAAQAAQAGEVVSLDRLAQVTWAHESPAHETAALRRALTWSCQRGYRAGAVIKLAEGWG